MSLRIRLLISIGCALLASFALSAALACWHAASSVRTELAAAMEVGAQTVRNGIEDFDESAPLAGEAARLVATFDGNRHVRAALLSPTGVVTAQSRPLLPDDPVPRWFIWLVAPRIPDMLAQLPRAAGGGAIRLRAEPANESSEAWVAFGYAAGELLICCLLASAVMLVTVGRALRPLAHLAQALDRVGPGNHGIRVPTTGAPEVARLAEGFNRMEERLAAVEIQNRRLNEQVLTLQDEERADLARDLHDEIGPFLFSINVSAATIDRLAAATEASGISAQVGLIREDVGHMQKHVRAILERLHPVPAIAFGLAPPVENVLAFWRARHPAIAFELDADADLEASGEASQEVAYRVVQEAVSNAIRHSRPHRVVVSLRRDAAGLTVRVTDDGQSGSTDGDGGLGLEGMRQRVSGLGGTLSAGPRQDAPGWEVLARLPRAPSGAEPELAAG
jgi:two-component system sensor histidine kinase UhpB